MKFGRAEYGYIHVHWQRWNWTRLEAPWLLLPLWAIYTRNHSTTVEKLAVPKVIGCKISLNRKCPSKIIYAAKGHLLRGEKITFLIDLKVLLQRRLKVTGYSLRHVPCSKRDNSQCSLALDYGYKRWTTDRGAPRAYTQPEGIGYLVGTVYCGRSNFVNIWTKIWPAEQSRVTSDTPDWQFLTYSMARWSLNVDSLLSALSWR